MLMPNDKNVLIPEDKNIFIASKPVDFRLSIDGLSRLIQQENSTHVLDGSIYVFLNGNKDKVKILFWDGNGFVLYYKRLVQCKFKLRQMFNSIETMSAKELRVLLSGLEPQVSKRKVAVLEHKA